jgi:hypothetical protein
VKDLVKILSDQEQNNAGFDSNLIDRRNQISYTQKEKNKIYTLKMQHSTHPANGINFYV